MWQRFILSSTPPASLISTYSPPPTAIQGDHPQAGTEQKSPISKSGKLSRRNKMIGCSASGCHLQNLPLVWFPQQAGPVTGPYGILQLAKKQVPCTAVHSTGSQGVGVAMRVPLMVLI